VSNSYGLPCVVFDGYISGPTIKDVAHGRRSKCLKGNHTIFDRNTPFLSNSVNKQNRINLFPEYLEAIGCQVLHAHNDADHLIVDTAVVAAAESGSSIVIIGEDTDLLVLLCSNDTTSVKNMYFMSDSKSATKKKTIWKLDNTRTVLGEEVCKCLPFIHAFSGCDTTSHIYRVGKSVLLKKCIKDENIRQLASIFLQPEVTHDTVQIAGETYL